MKFGVIVAFSNLLLIGLWNVRVKWTYGVFFKLKLFSYAQVSVHLCWWPARRVFTLWLSGDKFSNPHVWSTCCRLAYKFIAQCVCVPRAEIRYMCPMFRFVVHGICSQFHINCLLVQCVSHLITGIYWKSSRNSVRSFCYCSPFQSVLPAAARHQEQQAMISACGIWISLRFCSNVS